MQELIPFKSILISYTNFLSQYIKNLGLPKSKEKVLLNTFLKELSLEAEIVLQFELNKFRQTGNNNYNDFVLEMQEKLFLFYPVLDKILKEKTNNFLNYLSKIVIRFHKDIKLIITTFQLALNENELKIIDIKPSLGDVHDGERTALLFLSNGLKLIYKPRNIEIVNSYNSFINWVNKKSNFDLKVFNSLDRADYGWLEFVNHKAVNSEKELTEYYFQAGALLMVTTLLGSTDYHCENIIASGKNPVLIDHETIIQPYLNNSDINNQSKKYRFSVLESGLIFNQKSLYSPAFTGFGIEGLVEGSIRGSKIINPNTISSKRIKEIIKINLIQKNLPIKNGTYIFVNKFNKCFIEGFCTIYDLFLSSKPELIEISKDFFSNKKIRVLWRPTFVYVNILKYLTNTLFMSNYEAYQAKLKELLSYAYRDKSISGYQSILDAEVNQLLKGDIPLFSICSSDRFLEKETNLSRFDYSCIGNLINRVNLLSNQHKQEQLNYINKWMDVNNDSLQN